MPSIFGSKIVPFLWFTDDRALEAAQFYVSVFLGATSAAAPDTRILETTSMVVTFCLAGQRFCALNGRPDNPDHAFSPAVSLYVACDDQPEIDRLHAALVTDGGGKDLACGWLTDRYGLSWQLVPMEWEEMMKDPDKEKTGRAMKALWGMKGKLDIETLKRAHAGL